jgi:hypothetical protein
MISEAPCECRFWLRMSGYFGDDIGQPEQINRLRQEYLQHLAALVAGVKMEEVNTRETQIAIIVNSACWGLISQAIRLGVTALDEDSFIKAVTTDIRSLLRK